MQLTEIKNDLATINYSPELNRLLLSDFILIEDANQSILAQVISIEATMEDDVNSAMLKFLLSIDKNANLTQYTGYVPAKNATLILINPQEVVQLIKGNDKNVEMGNLASYPDISVDVSLDFLRKKPYIQVDFFENKLQIVENIIRNLEKHNKKTILFDFSGLYSRISLPTVTLGYNFKLPLNYEALCYIADEELNDCNNDNKAFIQGILIEIQNYVKSLPDKFIPFDTLISVLDSQYEEQNIPELLLLKNKLIKYQQLGIFAQEKSEFDFLNAFLKDAKNFKFDLSELPPQWQKIAFASIIDNIKAKYYLIADFTDDNSNKSIIKKVYEKSEIKPIVLSSYNYKYQLQLKALSKNMVLFKPIHKVNDFAGYTSFLNILSQDTFIIWGEHTLFIPLILRLNGSFSATLKNDSVINKTDIEETFIEPDTESHVTQEDYSEQIDIDKTSIEDTTTENEPSTDSNISYFSEENQDTSSATEILGDSDDFSSLEADYENNNYNESQTISETEIDQEIEISSESEINMESEAYEYEAVDVENIQEYSNENDLVETEEIIDNNKINTEYKQDSSDVPNADDLDFFFSNAENDFKEEVQDQDQEQEQEQEQEQSYTEDSDDIDNVYEPQVQEPQIIMDSDEEKTDDNTINLEEADLLTEQDVDNYEVGHSVENLNEIVLDDNLQEIDSSENKSQSETDIITENEDIDFNTDNLVEELMVEDDSDVITEDVDSVSVNEKAENTVESSKNINIPESKGIEIRKPSIPIYNSEVAPQFSAKYAQGTYVYHQKYGRGIVEKVTNSGNKELCLIVFDNCGRKLLDPNITELKQI